MGELVQLPNIGKQVEEQLNQVDINTIEDLQKLGSREAWLRIQAIDPSACCNRLCALEGALQGIRWHDLEPATKAELKTFYQTHKLS